MQDAVGRLAQGLGDGQLVHLLVVALLQVDDLAFRRAAHEDHREAVGRGVGERGQAVEEAGRRHREADAGLLRQVAGDRRRVARVLLVPEGDDPQSGSLGVTAEIGDRDAGHAVDRGDVVELERVDDEMEAVRQRPGLGTFALALLLNDVCRCIGHCIFLVSVCSNVARPSPGRRGARHAPAGSKCVRAPAAPRDRCRGPRAPR
jgi:hypothetical protein